MTLEDLGYKHIEEELPYLPYFRIRYEKDTTIYEIDGHKIPKDKLKYCDKTIVITNDGVECYDSDFIDSEPLTFDEMRALLEMKEKGEFDIIK